MGLEFFTYIWPYNLMVNVETNMSIPAASGEKRISRKSKPDFSVSLSVWNILGPVS